MQLGDVDCILLGKQIHFVNNYVALVCFQSSTADRAYKPPVSNLFLKDSERFLRGFKHLPKDLVVGISHRVTCETCRVL